MIGSLVLEQLEKIDTFLEKVKFFIETNVFPCKRSWLQHGVFHLLLQYFQGKSRLNESNKYLRDQAKITS